MPAPRTTERELAWERAVATVRRTSLPGYEALMTALALTAEDELKAMLDATPELLLKAQGRASVAAEFYERAFAADERIESVEEAVRQAAAKRAAAPKHHREPYHV